MPSNLSRPVAVGILLVPVCALAFVAGIGQPSVHYFFDMVATRDMGTILASLPWSRTGAVDFAYYALRHTEGPVNFIVTNLYYTLVGEVAGLGPWVASLPNIGFAAVAAGFAYALGRRVYSQKFGLVFAILFLVTPWLAPTARLAALYPTINCMMEMMVIYLVTMLAAQPERYFYRVLAPLALAVYLAHGLDWPAFGLFLAVYLFLIRGIKLVLLNVYNILPLAVVLVFIYWSSHLYLSDNPEFLNMLIIKPFIKVMGKFYFDIEKSLSFVFWVLGLTFFFAIAGFAATVRGARRAEPGEDRITAAARALPVAAAAWLVVALPPLIGAADRSLYFYGYVVAIPLSLLAALFVVRMPVKLVGLVIPLMIAWQWYQPLTVVASTWDRDDKRVLAVATYLIERRPDLLKEEKVAFLPRDKPANVAQYARGRHQRIIMPSGFPRTRTLTAVSSPRDVLEGFVSAYESSGRIDANWLVLTPELLETSGGAFFRRLSEDVGIRWIARFPDRHGREMWLGEVAAPGLPLSQAEVVQVEPLAERYLDRYDHLSFLSRNVDRAWHY